jgi:GTPase involved in cell partitioning and DNA repair
MADLPGIIEGAHVNRGMGHKFLKHIARTKVNVYIVDINGFQLNHKYQSRTAFETVVFLNKVF